MDIVRNIVQKWKMTPMRTSAEFDLALASFMPLFLSNTVALLTGETITESNAKKILAGKSIENYSGKAQAVFYADALYDYYRTIKQAIIVSNDDVSAGLADVLYIMFNTWSVLPPNSEYLYRLSFLIKMSSWSDAEMKDDDLQKGSIQPYLDGVRAMSIDDRNFMLLAAGIMQCVCRKNYYPKLNLVMAILLMNHYLLFRGYPPIVIFSEDREKYMDCIVQAIKHKNTLPLLDFLNESFIKTWSEKSMGSFESEEKRIDSNMTSSQSGRRTLAEWVESAQQRAEGKTTNRNNQ